MVEAITPQSARVTVAPTGRVLTLTLSTPAKAMACTLTPSQAALLRTDMRAALLVLDKQEGHAP